MAAYDAATFSDDSENEEDDGDDVGKAADHCPGCIEYLIWCATKDFGGWIATLVLRRKKWFIAMEETTQKRVEDMDIICKFALIGVATPVLKHVQETTILPPQEQTFFDASNAREIDGLNIWVPLEDEQPSSADSNKKGVPDMNWKKLKLLTSRKMNDRITDNEYFSDVEDGRQFCRDISNFCLQQTNSHIHDEKVLDTEHRDIFIRPDCDKSQGDLAYYGLGQFLLTNSNDTSLGEHMCDLTSMKNLEVRNEFERYGACAYFRWPSRAISCIYWCHGEQWVKPGDGNLWEHAKWAWRCSLFLWETAVLHLVHTHWMVSNALTSSLRGLPVEHPIRKVAHINTFGNAKVNQEALLALYERHALLHSACALRYKSLLDVFRIAADEWRYKTLPTMYAEHDLPDEVKRGMPVYADGMRYWGSLRNFYKAYIDIFYPNDAALWADEDLQRYWLFDCVPQMQSQGLPQLSKESLADQLTHAVFYSSIYHQCVGDVMRYLEMPNNMCWQIREGEDMADAKALLLVLNIAAKSVRDMPEIIGDNWYFDQWKSHVLPSLAPATYARINQLMDKLKGELDRLNADVVNENRRRPDGTRPEFWACSVSV